MHRSTGPCHSLGALQRGKRPLQGGRMGSCGAASSCTTLAALPSTYFRTLLTSIIPPNIMHDRPAIVSVWPFLRTPTQSGERGPRDSSCGTCGGIFPCPACGEGGRLCHGP